VRAREIVRERERKRERESEKEREREGERDVKSVLYIYNNLSYAYVYTIF